MCVVAVGSVAGLGPGPALIMIGASALGCVIIDG